MIPNTVNTLNEGLDDDSDYSDDDIDFSAIEHAAMKFGGMGGGGGGGDGGGGVGGRGSSRMSQHQEDRRRNMYQNMHRRSSLETISQERSLSHSHTQKCRTNSILSKDTNSSNDNSEATIFRRNGGIGASQQQQQQQIRLSSRNSMSEHSSVDHENLILNVNRDINSSYHNMSQIDEDDHVCRAGSFTHSEDIGTSISTANSTEQRTEPSVATGFNMSRESSYSNLRRNSYTSIQETTNEYKDDDEDYDHNAPLPQESLGFNTRQMRRSSFKNPPTFGGVAFGGSVRRTSFNSGAVRRTSFNSGAAVRRTSYGGDSSRRPSYTGGSAVRRTSYGGDAARRPSYTGGSAVRRTSYGGDAARRTSFSTCSGAAVNRTSFCENAVRRPSFDTNSFQPQSTFNGPRTSRKRRSYVDAESSDIHSAAAQVAQMFADGLLDSDTEEEMDNSSNNFSSRAPPRRDSYTSSLQLGGHGGEERPKKRLSSSARRSFHNPVIITGTNIGTGEVSADIKPFASHRESFTGGRRRESLQPIPGSGTSSTADLAAAAAAAAAEIDEPSGALMQRLSLRQDPGNSIQEDKPFNPLPPRRRVQRRAGFVVSSLEREAMESQAERMKRLEMDREESRRARGASSARRSLSYTSGIKIKSSIIGSCLPEDRETLLDCAEVEAQVNETPMAYGDDQDIKRLTRSRMERRVLSMPDPNAISRLSRASINEDVDFSNHSSMLSETLEASSEIERTIAATGVSEYSPSRQNLFMSNQYPSMPPPSLNTQNNGFGQQQNNFHLPTTTPQGLAPAQGFQGDIYSAQGPRQQRRSGTFSFGSGMPQSRGFESLPPTNPAAMHGIPGFQNIELQSAAALQANAILAQTISQTQQASVLLQTADMLINGGRTTPISNIGRTTPMSNIGRTTPMSNLDIPPYQHQSCNLGVPVHMHTPLHTPRNPIFNDDEFDGKTSHIISIPATSADYNNAATLLQEACKKDDIPIIQKVLETCPLATRIVVDDTDTGDVAIHIAARNSSNIATRMLLDADRDCAHIRNAGGHVALHIAVQNGNLPIVTTITSMVPDCSQIQCEEGFLPLHDAVSEGARYPDAPQIIALLQHRFGNAVFVSNDEGLLPIHLASSSGFTAGLRTLLSSEFPTILCRDKLENMTPLDIAVNELEETMGENLGRGQQDESRNNRTEEFISCVETILSSMLYNRLISNPRDDDAIDHPFLPLHSAIKSYPLQQTWSILFTLYSDDHGSDVDSFERNIAHAVCSREIEDIITDTAIVDDISEELFLQIDKYGFIPLHLSVQNPNAHFDFVKAVVGRQKSSLPCEVQPLLDNMYAHFVPFQIAAAASCDLNIIYFLIRSHPSGVNPV